MNELLQRRWRWRKERKIGRMECGGMKWEKWNRRGSEVEEVECGGVVELERQRSTRKVKVEKGTKERVEWKKMVGVERDGGMEWSGIDSTVQKKNEGERRNKRGREVEEEGKSGVEWRRWRPCVLLPNTWRPLTKDAVHLYTLPPTCPPHLFASPPFPSP